MHVLTWNVGGLAPDQVLQLLCDLCHERIRPFHLNFVLLLQEVIVTTGKHESEKDDVHFFAGKHDSDWCGTTRALHIRLT